MNRLSLVSKVTIQSLESFGSELQILRDLNVCVQKGPNLRPTRVKHDICYKMLIEVYLLSTRLSFCPYIYLR